MHDALIGYTGFVGSTLMAQYDFAGLYRSSNIEALGKTAYDTLYCAGAPGQKWLANQTPQEDAANIARLCAALGTARCRRVVLLSTVDVYAEPQGVDERDVPAPGRQAYGTNRRILEKFVVDHFAEALVVRLPGLVGTELRKNALFDLARRRRLDALQAEAVFQFYPVRHLWADVQRALVAGLDCVHLTAAPTQLGELAREAFGIELPAAPHGAAPAPSYDLRSTHASLWGKSGPYQYDRNEVLQAVRHYAGQVRRQEAQATPAPALHPASNTGAAQAAAHAPPTEARP